MDDSDNKIVPEDVDFMESPGGPGPEAANWKAPQPDSALGGGGESQQVSEQTSDNPTSRTRQFLRNLRNDTNMKINAGGTLFAGGLGVLAASGGNLKLAAAEGILALGAAVRTGLRSGDVVQENAENEARQVRLQKADTILQENARKLHDLHVLEQTLKLKNKDGQ